METNFTPFAEYIKSRTEAESTSDKGSESQVDRKDGFQIQQYKAGDTIFSQGARGHAAYVIKSGKVEISVVEEGKKSVLTCLGEAAVFGEVALLTGEHTRSATAVALEDTLVVRIPKEVFEQYLKASPKVISSCLVAIAHRLQEFSTSAQARPATLERMARVMHLLLSHGTSVFDYDLTLETLARILDRERAEIEKHLITMADVNLVELKPAPDGDPSGKKAIVLLGEDNFLEKALKVFSMIEGYEPV